MGLSRLSVWQTCQASNVADCEFPGVCALFTGSCRPTFRGAVGNPSWHPAFVGAAALTQVRSHRLITGKGEDIKGVCHTSTPAHASFVFTEICVLSGEHALVKRRGASQPHCWDIRTGGEGVLCSTCWRVSGGRRQVVFHNHCPRFCSQTDKMNGHRAANLFDL